MNRLVLLFGCLLLIVGCQSRGPELTSPVVVQEVKIPIPSCPSQIEHIQYPIRPVLAIDGLTPEDATNFTKVGTAYMSSINDLKKYAGELESITGGVREMCNTVNTTSNGSIK